MGVGAKETLRAPECRLLFQRILGQKMPMWNGNESLPHMVAGCKYPGWGVTISDTTVDY